jgi:Uma2 family endonuclease
MTSIPDRASGSASKLTYADYAKLPDDGRRYEILDGELAVTPAPVPRHQAVSRNLLYVLHGYVRDRGLGEVFDAPIDVILADTTIVEPDLVFVSTAKRQLITERAIEGPPDLMVEILSPHSQRHDRITKFALYARFGIPHYWIVDTGARSIELYELAEGSYQLIATAGHSDRVQPSLFPGLTIDLGAVWY